MSIIRKDRHKSSSCLRSLSKYTVIAHACSPTKLTTLEHQFFGFDNHVEQNVLGIPLRKNHNEHLKVKHECLTVVFIYQIEFTTFT